MQMEIKFNIDEKEFKKEVVNALQCKLNIKNRYLKLLLTQKLIQAIRLNFTKGELRQIIKDAFKEHINTYQLKELINELHKQGTVII